MAKDDSNRAINRCGCNVAEQVKPAIGFHEITLEQSQFEPPATIRQAKISLDRATRAYEQAVKNYQLKVQQSKADMTEVTVDLAKQQRIQMELLV